jgi:acetyl-CoA acetyltransferase
MDTLLAGVSAMDKQALCIGSSPGSAMARKSGHCGQCAKMAVNQRFNALTNANAVFQGQPITIDDVPNSRMVNDPLWHGR